MQWLAIRCPWPGMCDRRHHIWMSSFLLAYLILLGCNITLNKNLCQVHNSSLNTSLIIYLAFSRLSSTLRISMAVLCTTDFSQSWLFYRALSYILVVDRYHLPICPARCISKAICQRTCVSLIVIYVRRHKAESDRNTSAIICKELPSVGIAISSILSGRFPGSWLMHCRAICIIFLSCVASAICNASIPKE